MGVNVDVSVVIPTQDRPEGVARLLDGLRRQTIDPARFEAIVVDDGSRQPLVLEPRDLRLRVVRHERPRGPAAARNSGWREAGADTVVFIDDDCVPSERWLEAVLRAADGPRVVVQGRVEPMPDQPLHPLSHTIEVLGPNRMFITANIAYPRALLERLDGFDERLRRACGEDVELGVRATQAGALVRFAPDAVVYHEVRDLTLSDHIRHRLKWTDAVGVLAQHPELRSMLSWGLFWKPTHPWLIGAAAALAARRPGLAAAALSPYLLHYRRLYGGDLGRLTRALPAHVVIDSAEVLTAVAGSVRHRTLML